MFIASRSQRMLLTGKTRLVTFLWMVRAEGAEGADSAEGTKGADDTGRC